MNQVIEVIFAILFVLILILPFNYLYFTNDDYNKKILFQNYYNFIRKNNLRNCLISENCNVSFIKSYNCSHLNNIVYPKNYVAFYIIGNKEKFCPTLVIINLEEIKETKN